jgi:general stress protein 26
MAEETSPQDARAKVWELIEQFPAAMLVTRSQAGQLSARPMAHMARPDANVVYILTERQTEAARDIEHDPGVLLTFADGKRYLSLAAHGMLSTDRSLIEQLWNSGAQAFWPKGPSDPAVCAVILRPRSAEYWDGDNALSAGVQMLLANVAGKRPDLGDHGGVGM